MNCKECGSKYIQSKIKQLCGNCVYKHSHDGKTQFEVQNERKQVKLSNSITSGIKPLITVKNKVKQVKSNKTSDKRKEQLLKDRETYFEVFNTKPNHCEECGQWLPNEFEDDNGNIVLIGQYSHILSKGAWGEYRNETWNLQRLCCYPFPNACHTKYEFGDRKSMKTYHDCKEKVLKHTGLDLLK